MVGCGGGDAGQPEGGVLPVGDKWRAVGVAMGRAGVGRWGCIFFPFVFCFRFFGDDT